MTRINWTFSTLLFIGLMISSCGKNKSATTATITFEEPVAMDTIYNGNELHIEGTVEADGKMHGYSISVLDSLNGVSYLERASDSRKSSYAFHEHWVNNVTDTVHAVVELIVHLNDNGLKMSKKVPVVLLP